MKAKASSLFNPIKTKRIFEEISQQIKNLILDGHLKPGEKLPSEREIALQFHSGRMVVREALRILEHAGFIYIKQGSDGGAFVKDLDTSVASQSISDLIKFKNASIQSLTEARLSIERVIIEHVIERSTSSDHDLLEKNLKSAEKKIDKGIRSSKENLEFHLLLAKSTKNPIFEMMIRSVLDVTRFYIYKLNPNIAYRHKVLSYHQAIFYAIKEKDKERAEQKMVEHLMDVNSHLSELMLTL